MRTQWRSVWWKWIASMLLSCSMAQWPGSHVHHELNRQCARHKHRDYCASTFSPSCNRSSHDASMQLLSMHPDVTASCIAWHTSLAIVRAVVSPPHRCSCGSSKCLAQGWINAQHACTVGTDGLVWKSSLLDTHCYSTK
ncbi:hypothetical protein JKP88DRAFT_236224 [Tribonema minus]|uniref:Secreted protein n=1 Tax=Tribonema minus TaxID=303371 RepID=A0A835ZBN7_9STRA|nr:hypothetical protein JKP88DRAFT_236224 [Tribonema minus]